MTRAAEEPFGHDAGGPGKFGRVPAAPGRTASTMAAETT